MFNIKKNVIVASGIRFHTDFSFIVLVGIRILYKDSSRYANFMPRMVLLLQPVYKFCVETIVLLLLPVYKFWVETIVLLLQPVYKFSVETIVLLLQPVYKFCVGP